MSREINDVRKSIEKRRKQRHQVFDNTLNKQVTPLPDNEEKHGYLPSHILDGNNNKDTNNNIFNTRTNRILLKAIAALALFIGSHFIIKTNNFTSEKPKEIAVNVLTEDFPFARVYLWYQDTFGTPLAFSPSSSNKVQHANKTDENMVLPVNGTITKPFEHNGKGIYISPKETSDVMSWKEGMVLFAGNDRKLNKTVIIQHEDRSKTIYGNLSSIDVHLYQFVPRYEIIGSITPTESEETFYFSLQKNNKYIDPFQVIQVDDIP